LNHHLLQEIPGAVKPRRKEICTHVGRGSQNVKLEKQLKVSRDMRAGLESWNIPICNNPISAIFLKRDCKISIQICLSSNKRHELYTRCHDENRKLIYTEIKVLISQLQGLPTYTIDKIQSSIWLPYQKSSFHSNNVVVVQDL